MAGCLDRTPLKKVLPDARPILGSGKMLRARLAVRIGPAAGTPLPAVLNIAAAVELIHAASLLHDDVIDGGMLRRGAPTFWTKRGSSGAILLGDVVLFEAMELVIATGIPDLLRIAIEFTGEVCEAEAEQELVLRGRPSTWDDCVSIARCKTGALFALAAQGAGSTPAELARALREAGYLAGTAYQLSDDLLDVNGTTESAGKTLGRDAARSKGTAATVRGAPADVGGYVDQLCRSAAALLKPWPRVLEAWDAYLSLDFRPALDKNLGLATAWHQR